MGVEFGLITQLLNDLILLHRVFIWEDQPCKKTSYAVLSSFETRFYPMMIAFIEQVGDTIGMTVMKEDIGVHLRPTMRKITVPVVVVTNAHARDPIHHVSSHLDFCK